LEQKGPLGVQGHTDRDKRLGSDKEKKRRIIALQKKSKESPSCWGESDMKRKKRCRHVQKVWDKRRNSLRRKKRDGGSQFLFITGGRGGKGKQNKRFEVRVGKGGANPGPRFYSFPLGKGEKLG